MFRKGGEDRTSERPASVHAQCLHRRCQRFRKEDGVHSLYNFPGHFQEVPLVFQWHQGTACSIVHADLQRFGQRADSLNVPLNTQVSLNNARRAREGEILARDV